MAVAPARAEPKIGRNELCPCGLGEKRKRCRASCAAPVGLAPHVRRNIIDKHWPTLSDGQRAKLAACDPILWAMYASRGAWFSAPHLELLADELLAVVRGDVLRLSVSLPPQHGKTEFISIYFPTWYAGRFPTARVLQCSYGQDLTVEWTARARDLFAEHGPAVFGVDTWTRSKRTAWNVYRNGRRTGGGVRGVGKGGAVAGRPVDLGILDDLIKDADDADSQPQRNRLFKWLRSVVFARCRRLINVGTRWHNDDHVGRLMALQKKGEIGERWRFVNIPAIADSPDDPLGRPIGAPLWLANPLAMGDPLFYEKKRLDVGPYVWEALHQGHPTPETGKLFEKGWLRYYDEGERGTLLADRVNIQITSLLVYLTVDPAWSKKTSADYSVVMVWGLDRENQRLFLLDVVRRRMTAPELGKVMAEKLERWKANVAYVEAQNLKLDQMKVLRKSAAGVPMQEIQPNTDKVARFMPVQAWAARGALLFRRNAEWGPELERELLEFDDGDHDDQVDGVSYGVHVANKFGLPSNPPELPPDTSPPRVLVPNLVRPRR